MKQKCLLVSVYIVCLWITSTCSIPCFAGEGITLATRKDDPRLQTPVTLVAPRIYIADLLEKLSAQSHVAITCGLQDGAGDSPVCVRLKEVPLGDALDALWSLVGYQKAEWRWDRNGEKGAYTYHLARPLMAQRFPEYLHEQIQAEFESLCLEMMKAARMTPKERKAFLAEFLPKRLEIDKKEVALWSSPLEDRTWGGIRMFMDTFSQEQQLRILRSQESPRVNVSDLNAEGKAWVHRDWLESSPHRILSNGTTEPKPEPEKIQFHTTYSQGTHTAPAMSIYTEGGYPYFGGTPFEKAIQKKLEALWFLESDVLEDAKEKQKLELPRERVVDATVRLLLEDRLVQVAEAGNLSLLARLPVNYDDSRFDPGSPYGKTVGAYLKRLRDNFDYHNPHKWRDGILLVNYPAWFKDEKKKAPWPLIKRLREVQEKNAGWTPLRELGIVASQINDEQIATLSFEFPILNQLRRDRTFFALFSREPLLLNQLLTPRGVRLADVLDKMQPDRIERLGTVENPDARLRIYSKINVLGKDYYLQISSDDTWKILGGSSLMVDPGPLKNR